MVHGQDQREREQRADTYTQQNRRRDCQHQRRQCQAQQPGQHHGQHAQHQRPPLSDSSDQRGEQQSGAHFRQADAAEQQAAVRSAPAKARVIGRQPGQHQGIGRRTDAEEQQQPPGVWRFQRQRPGGGSPCRERRARQVPPDRQGQYGRNRPQCQAIRPTESFCQRRGTGSGESSAAHDAGGVESHQRAGPLRMAAVDVRRYQRLHQGNPHATQCGGEDQPRTVRRAPAQGTGQRHQREPERYATALAQLRLQHGAAKCAESHGSDGQGGKCACTGAAQTGRGLDFIE